MLMTLGDLKQTLQEERKRPTKAQLVCYVMIMDGNVPMTSYDILRKVHEIVPTVNLYGHAHSPLNPRTNHSYFAARNTGHNATHSLLVKGILKVVGKTKSGSRLFQLADENLAEREAIKVDEWMQLNADTVQNT